MSCDPVTPCQSRPAHLGLIPPSPGQVHLHRRAGEFHGFLAELIADTERRIVNGEALGKHWDIEGDPRASLLAKLWAFVAEGVAAYTELTAAESYLGTAQDWMDLRRLAGLVGYRPRPRVAAKGWAQVDIDKGANPVVPAETRLQAPGTPERQAQTFEVIEDTTLRADWASLTATLVPEPAVPTAPDERKVRLLGDPGFRQGDHVLLVLEEAQPAEISFDWFEYWFWLGGLLSALPTGTSTPLAVASVVGREIELGTSVVEFDRDLAEVLGSEAQAETKPYAAYRIRQTAGAARRVSKVLRIPASGSSVDELALGGSDAVDPAGKYLILDAALEDVSRGQLVALVDWEKKSCDVTKIDSHRPVSWEVTPGTPVRVSRLNFAEAVGTLQNPKGPITAYVLDRRVVARHYRFVGNTEPGATRLRLYPRPESAPPRIAVETNHGGTPRWDVYVCRQASDQSQEPETGAEMPRGLVVDILDGPIVGDFSTASASGNLVQVRHGSTTKAGLGSGDASTTGQRFSIPDAPIAYDLNESGTPVPSQVLRVDGLNWDELPSLFGAGPAQAFTVELGPDGSVTDVFGDGEQGARLPSGRGNVTAVYRVGGGLAGEVEPGAIDTLLGSVRGVKKVRGAGSMTGGSDQDSERQLQSLAPARARAFARAVSVEDLVDLTLGFPGVTHAVAWSGSGPPGCACGGPGLHVAFLRAAHGGSSRGPLAPEIEALSSYLDERRDPTVPLCVSAGIVTELYVAVGLAVDPRQELSSVSDAAARALLDPEGPLGPGRRTVGQPLDRSDLIAVLHGVAGVAGVSSLMLPGVTGDIGRRAAESYELLLLDKNSNIEAAHL